MNIRDEEQLQQYFERQMSGAQEQNFLINVAARDDMRLAFRSQLELLKAVREDKDASGSPMFARSRTLTALGLGGALVPSSLKEQEVQAASIIPQSALQSIGSFFRRPAISITTGLLAGILGTAFLMPANVSETHSPHSAPIISVPVVVPVPEKVTSAPVTNEITKDQPKHSTRTSVSHNTVDAANKQVPSTPVINNNKPGTIDVNTTIHKPGDAEKK